jgi:hypothetical protein
MAQRVFDVTGGQHTVWIADHLCTIRVARLAQQGPETGGNLSMDPDDHGVFRVQRISDSFFNLLDF